MLEKMYYLCNNEWRVSGEIDNDLTDKLNMFVEDQTPRCVYKSNTENNIHHVSMAPREPDVVDETLIYKP